MARSLRVCLLAFALSSAALLGAWLVPARWVAAAGAGSEIAQAGGAESAGAIAPLLRARVAASAARGAAIPLAAALAVLLLRSRRTAILLLAVDALVFLDEALLAFPLAPTVDATLYDRVPRAVRVILSDRPPAGRVWIDESLEAFSVRTLVQPGMRFVSDGFLLQRERLKQNIALAYGLSTAFAGDVERFAPVPYTVLRHLVETFGPRERDLLLSASAVTHVVSVLDRTGPGLELLARLDIGAERPLSIYRNTRAYARIRMVSALLIYQNAIQLQSALRTGDDRLLADAALVDASTLGPGLRSLPGSPGPAGTHVLSPLPGGAAPRWGIRVLEDRGPVLQVETVGPAGFLLVADSYTPGWAARVDGRPQQILLANVAFRAVPVPAGRHLVSLTYDPWSQR